MKLFQDKKNILIAIALLASVVAFVTYLSVVVPYIGYTNRTVILLFVLSIVMEIMAILLKNEWSGAVKIILAFVCAAIPMLVVTQNDVIMSFVDLVNNIDYFGNAEMIPSVIVTVVLGLISTLFIVVGAFFERKTD